MTPYRIHVTGEGLGSMDLTFTGMNKYGQWIKQVTDIRSGTTLILANQFQKSVICNLHYAWIPQVKDFEVEWGSDFVLTHIKTNLEEARRFWD